MNTVPENVLVTGGQGFLGRHLCTQLALHGYVVWTMPHSSIPSKGVDLEDVSQTEIAYNNLHVKHVFHLAGYNGGIVFNSRKPADIFYSNTVMGLNVLEACANTGVKKVVSVVASCAYPQRELKPTEDEEGLTYWEIADREVMVEDDFLDGPPHASVACHGYAKRNLQLASAFYKQQYGLNAVCACPTTLYGPGDSFDPERTKVMGALIKKFVDAVDSGEQRVVLWGSGTAMREFLYVKDAAKLLIEVMNHYDDSTMPLNLGTGQEFSIKEVAEMVAHAVGYTGEIVWDTSKPDGQHRKRLDLTRMHQILPPFTPTPITEGIHKTVEYYRQLCKR